MCSNSSENATGRVGSIARLEVRAEVHSEFDTLEKSVDSCQPKGRAESEVVEIQGERLDSDGSKAALVGRIGMSCFAPRVARPDNFRSSGFYRSGNDSVGQSSTENTGSVEMSRVNEGSNGQVGHVAEQRDIWGIKYGSGVQLSKTQFLWGNVRYVYSSMSIARRRGVSHCGDAIEAERELDE